MSPVIVAELVALVTLLPCQHVAGGVAPAWYATIKSFVAPPPELHASVIEVEVVDCTLSPEGFGTVTNPPSVIVHNLGPVSTPRAVTAEYFAEPPWKLRPD